MRQTIASPPPWPECREDRKRLRKRFEEKVQFDLGPEGQVGVQMEKQMRASSSKDSICRSHLVHEGKSNVLRK